MTSALELGPVTRMPPAGRYGPQTNPGITVEMSDPPGLATLAARRGQMAELVAATRQAFGLDLVDGPQVSRSEGMSAVGTGPGRWFVLGDAPGDMSRRLAPLAAYAAITEQTDGYVAFALAGPRVDELLAKGVTIDLHPSAFPPGRAATTNVAHINLTLWREAPDRHVLLVGRSHAVGFARFLIASGAEYGLSFARRG
ncbi:sarcosine oxidase subunit gamma [Ancylobacter mangrovi]|uniref:sarcosine oxidase subunit gamma n=1 Tax=Ancylobacter mangrovi TaxID=2972472 RepID=UPI0021618BBC|nr:sarcosine oxidase subunit gamma family protein [Ancylobacter mangrovi]MCS0500902.1 sarcosine oxidase subunit gamma [Ancylobacter mangrovi]